LVKIGANLGNIDCVRFVAQVNIIPEWMDEGWRCSLVIFTVVEKIKEGQEFFKKNPLATMLGLFASIIISYLGEYRIQVLVEIIEI
jgi:hypothetical protein